MGIFSKKKVEVVETISPEELNAKRLKAFEPTKAWGIKKYEDAIQFIYDEDKRQFVVVEGPEATFRERNPHVFAFSDVIDVYMHVVQFWTEERNQGEDEKGTGKLEPERFGEVFWHYDIYLHILTKVPGYEDICFKMNYKPTIIQVPSHDGTRRGLELNGLIRNKGYTVNIKRLEAWNEEAEFEGTDLERANMSKVRNIVDHLKRARRINKLIN